MAGEWEKVWLDYRTGCACCCSLAGGQTLKSKQQIQIAAAFSIAIHFFNSERFNNVFLHITIGESAGNWKTDLKGCTMQP